MAKKFFSKALSVGLALALCASLAAPVFAADPECATCGGTGSILGKVTCSACGGWGDEWDAETKGMVPCKACGGAGSIESSVPCTCNTSTECEHSNREVVVFKEPDCVNQGDKWTICADCGKKISQIPYRALGHDKYVAEVEPTCTTPGGSYWKCTRCDWVGAIQTGVTIDHNWVRDEEATPVEGSIQYKCTMCGETKSDTCGHESSSERVEAATCELMGKKTTVCDDCGSVISQETISPLGHRWDNGVMYGNSKEIVYSCVNCGEKKPTYSADDAYVTDKPYTREIEVCMGFQTADGTSFSLEDIPEDFSVTYSYEWNGETIEVELSREDAILQLRPKAYQDENGEWIFDDETQEKYSTIHWTVRVPVDPKTGEVMKGTILNVTETGHDGINGYEWDHAYGYNPAQSTDGTGILYVPADGTPVTWVYNVYAKTASYTINYYYGGVLGSTNEGTGRVGNLVAVSRVPANYQGQVYEFSSVSGNTTLIDGENVINVYYTLPVVYDPIVPGEIEIEDEEVPLAGLFTRGDAIGYLWEKSGSPEWELSDFEDVPEDHQWAVAIGWAQDMGIAVADQEGNFRPDDLVLHSVEDIELSPEGELQEFLNRYAVYAGIELEPGELFIELDGAWDDIVMGEDAQVIFDGFFAKLEAALAQAA